MKRRSRAALALVLAAVLGLTACAGPPVQNAQPETEQAAALDILPYANGAGSDVRNLTLYFGYGQENCLVPVSRQVEVSADERVEKALIEEMIKGPAQSDSLDLTPLINPETQVVSVSNRSGYLFITLSQEFLNTPVEIPQGMEEDASWQEQVNRVRRLSVDALVNAITELGAYTHIYLLVDDGSGQGVRILREQVGYLVNGQLPLEPMVRNANIILTPYSLVQLVMEAMSARQWQSMSRYVAWDGAAQDLSSKLLQQTVLQYHVDGEHVSEDGQSAVVTLSVTLKNADGVETQTTAPLRCRRVSGVWKLEQSALAHLGWQ